MKKVWKGKTNNENGGWQTNCYLNSIAMCGISAIYYWVQSSESFTIISLTGNGGELTVLAA